MLKLAFYHENDIFQYQAPVYFQGALIFFGGGGNLTLFRKPPVSLSADAFGCIVSLL